MVHVVMYTSRFCPYCMMAERFLAQKGISEIEKIRVDTDNNLMQEMMTKTGRRTVPQIFIGEQHVGGYDDLVALDKQGELTPLLG